jgi:hypothetical protein
MLCGLFLSLSYRSLAISQSFFYGNGFISRALECSDADKTGIIDNVTAFIKKCPEAG